MIEKISSIRLLDLFRNKKFGNKDNKYDFKIKRDVDLLHEMYLTNNEFSDHTLFLISSKLFDLNQVLRNYINSTKYQHFYE